MLVDRAVAVFIKDLNEIHQVLGREVQVKLCYVLSDFVDRQDLVGVGIKQVKDGSEGQPVRKDLLCEPLNDICVGQRY